ncbi:hypothetical protein AOLI_G00143020 [Acnodon oligacanthus]
MLNGINDFFNKSKDIFNLNETCDLMRNINNSLGKSDLKTMMSSVKYLEEVLENTQISKSESLTEGNVTAYLNKADKRFRNVTVHVNHTMASSQVMNSTAQIFLPEELVAEAENSTIIVCIVTSPLDFEVNRVPKCVFYNFTFFDFDGSGCSTNWRTGQDWVICSCDHLTFFAVLMVSPKYVSKKDEEALSYISLIGCSLSLLFLVVTVLLYFIKRRSSADQSQRVHISLTVALILLNGHFIMNDLVVNVQTACIYVAVLLHYSLLATFTWTAIEGFHLYLLLLRVFNIYIRRYLLKLSLVGWGIPAIVVILIFITDKSVYLHVGSSSENSKYNNVCYISNELVKDITIFGFFCVIFAFNLAMLVVVVRTLFFQRPVFPGQHQKRRAKDVCTILGITCLLGITWGLIFLSFGQLSTVGLYFFCIFNSLQGE